MISVELLKRLLPSNGLEAVPTSVHTCRTVSIHPSARLVYLSVYLSISCSTYLPTYLPAYLPTYLPTYLHLPPTYLHGKLSISLFGYLRIYPSIHLHILLSTFCLFKYLSNSIYLSACLKIYLRVYLSTYLPIYRSIYLSVRLFSFCSIYLPIHLHSFLSM